MVIPKASYQLLLSMEFSDLNLRMCGLSIYGKTKYKYWVCKSLILVVFCYQLGCNLHLWYSYHFPAKLFCQLVKERPVLNYVHCTYYTANNKVHYATTCAQTAPSSSAGFGLCKYSTRFRIVPPPSYCSTNRLSLICQCR